MDIQDGFIYPYFKLTRSILLDLDLITPGDDTTPSPAIHFFDPTLNTWVKIKMDSIIELTKPSQKLFFKVMNVTSYPQFDQHIHSATSREPNPHVSLSQERSYVKNSQVIMHMCQLDAFDALLELSSAEESMSSPQKRRHRMPTQSTPALLLDFQSRQAHLLESGTSRLICR